MIAMDIFSLNNYSPDSEDDEFRLLHHLTQYNDWSDYDNWLSAAKALCTLIQATAIEDDEDVDMTDSVNVTINKADGEKRYCEIYVRAYMHAAKDDITDENRESIKEYAEEGCWTPDYCVDLANHLPIRILDRVAAIQAHMDVRDIKAYREYNERENARAAS
jgi:hypothetical protein